MKYLMLFLLAGCATPKNPNSKIYDCMLELIDRGVHAEIAQKSCSKTFERGDSLNSIERYIKMHREL